MKSFKKILSLILVLVTVFGMLPAGIFASADTPMFSDLDGFSWARADIEELARKNSFKSVMLTSRPTAYEFYETVGYKKRSYSYQKTMQ